MIEAISGTDLLRRDHDIAEGWRDSLGSLSRADESREIGRSRLEAFLECVVGGVGLVDPLKGVLELALDVLGASEQLAVEVPVGGLEQLRLLACPGRFFASTELKTMLAYLLLHYDIEPGPQPELDMWRVASQIGGLPRPPLSSKGELGEVLALPSS